jgi:hypothetical protein
MRNKSGSSKYWYVDVGGMQKLYLFWFMVE